MPSQSAISLVYRRDPHDPQCNTDRYLHVSGKGRGSGAGLAADDRLTQVYAAYSKKMWPAIP
jgi:hypothetical protein